MEIFAVPKSPLNLNIETRVKYSALRLFAGAARGKKLSDFVQSALVRECVKNGEVFPSELMPKRKAAKFSKQ